MSNLQKILSVCGAVVLASAFTGTLTTAETSNETPLEITVPDEIDLWIERLAYEEWKPGQPLEIVDTNGKWSRGCLMYQDATFTYFKDKYSIEGDRLDCPTQKRLTRQILLNEPLGYRHWLTSHRKLEARGVLPPL